MNQNDIVGRGALKLFLGVVFDAHLRRRSSRWSDWFRLLVEAGHATIALFCRLDDGVVFAVASVRLLALGCLWLADRYWDISRVNASGSGPLNILCLFDKLRALALGHDAVFGWSARSFALLDNMSNQVPWQVVLDGHLLGNEAIDISSGFKFAFVWLA